MVFFEQFLMVPKAESEKIPKIKQIIESFVLAVSETAITNNISEGMLSLLRPLYLFVAVDSQRVYLVFSNRGAIRGQTQWFYYEHEKEAVMAPDAPMKAAIKDLGFPHDDVSYVSLPARLLEMNEAKWEVELQKIAYEYVQSEIQHQERLRKLVRILPIFKGRDFTLDENMCFVLMPLSQEFQPIYDDHIKNTIVNRCSMKCIRADDIFSNREIIEDVWECINKAKVVVADLTGRNANVYYEVGICHTVGKEVILLAQSLDDIPFDLRHLRVILYDYTPRGCQELETKLANTLMTILQK